MKSMTGYGRGESGADGTKIVVELQSVNRKQLDINVALPREFSTLDADIRAVVNQKVSRGRLNVAVDVSTPENSQRLVVDHSLASQYRDAALELKKELGLDGPLDFETILRSPGVLRIREEGLSPEQALPHITQALELALADLSKMRLREGKHLARDLIGRLKLVRQTIRKIQKLHPDVLIKHRQNLQERIAQAGFEIDATDERLLKELAFFADRSDISEELTRLESHLAQFAHQLRSNDPVGRPLDFLTLEIQRELNTLGAKANDAEIAQCVVACKAEMEKIREQVQNIE